MCVRSTIQNEECSLPLVRAVILTKWTSASRHCETRRRTESGGGIKSLKEWDGESCGNLPTGPGPFWRTCGQKSAGGPRLVKGYERKAVRYICTFMIIRPSLWSLAGMKVAWHVVWCCWAGLRGVSEPTSVLHQTRDAACDVFSVLLQARHGKLETVHCKKNLAGQKYLSALKSAICNNLPDVGVGHTKRNLVSTSPEY